MDRRIAVALAALALTALTCSGEDEEQFGVSTSTLTYTVLADAPSRLSTPSTNNGSATSEWLEKSATENRRSYLRFSVSEPAGNTITGAQLRLKSKNYTNSVGCDIVAVADNSWTEGGLTWNNQPPLGAVIASINSIAPNTVYTVDVSSYVTANGVYSFALRTRGDASSSYFSFESRETNVVPGTPPQLIVTSQSTGPDTTPPDTTIDSGPAGTTSSTAAQFTFSASEPATFACRLDGAAFAACTSPKSYTGLAIGSHTFEVRATDGAGNVDASPASRTWTITEATGDIVMAAVGDMNPESNTSTTSPSGKNAASILAANVDLFLGLGDFQYTSGTCATLVSYWDKVWGSLMPKTFHIAGPTHDWLSATDQGGYRAHFDGACAGQTTGKSAAVQLLGRSIGPGEAYSFDRGNWHFTMMPSALWRYSTADANAVTSWLDADLAAAKAAGKHLLVAWHDPYWTSSTSSHTRELATKPWVQVVDNHNVRILLSGSQHNVEIFHPQNVDDTRNDATGTQQFQVSTGGISLRSFTSTPPNLIARDSATHGWLKLVLHADGSYDWQFVPVSGTFSHTGSRPAP
jgi:hypothetical protein